MTETYSLRNPRITQEFLNEIARAFRAPDVNAKSDPDKVKWEAAQHEVVIWIARKAGDMPALTPIKTVAEEPDPEPVPVKLPWYKRLWQKLRGS